MAYLGLTQNQRGDVKMFRCESNVGRYVRVRRAATDMKGGLVQRRIKSTKNNY